MSNPSELIYACGGEIDAGEFSVSITSENLDPDSLAEQLAMQPTKSHRRNDTFGKSGRRYGYGEWCFSSGRLDFRSGKSCEKQFDDFVRSLPDDTTAWERITAEHEARVFIVLWMRTWNREFDISCFALGELARRKLQLHIDTYLESDADDVA
jgi:hypothetical protein